MKNGNKNQAEEWKNLGMKREEENVHTNLIGIHTEKFLKLHISIYIIHLAVWINKLFRSKLHQFILLMNRKLLKISWDRVWSLGSVGYYLVLLQNFWDSNQLDDGHFIDHKLDWVSNLGMMIWKHKLWLSTNFGRISLNSNDIQRKKSR